MQAKFHTLTHPAFTLAYPNLCHAFLYINQIFAVNSINDIFMAFDNKSSIFFKFQIRVLFHVNFSPESKSLFGLFKQYRYAIIEHESNLQVYTF